jgi:hypothetical protein
MASFNIHFVDFWSGFFNDGTNSHVPGWVGSLKTYRQGQKNQKKNDLSKVYYYIMRLLLYFYEANGFE